MIALAKADCSSNPRSSRGDLLRPDGNLPPTDTRSELLKESTSTPPLGGWPSSGAWQTGRPINVGSPVTACELKEEIFEDLTLAVSAGKSRWS